MSAAVGSLFPAASVAQHHRRRRRAAAAQCSAVAAAAAAPILNDLRLQRATPLPVLRRVADTMAAGMRSGLAADDGVGELKMIPSYVYSLPTGNETGLFYCLDLGGTNFRVLRVQLGGKDKRVIDAEFEQVSIPNEIMHATTEVNDTVGTLAGAHYWDDDVMVAVILGTGTNACYIERTESVPKLQHLGLGTGNTIINTEWGIFSDSLPLTEFDRDMDGESINPGEQILEKTISGMYLGEIVRRVLVKMAEVSDLFGYSFSDKLAEHLLLHVPSLLETLLLKHKP